MPARSRPTSRGLADVARAVPRRPRAGRPRSHARAHGHHACARAVRDIRGPEIRGGDTRH